jgi:hypothetical protein
MGGFGRGEEASNVINKIGPGLSVRRGKYYNKTWKSNYII